MKRSRIKLGVLEVEAPIAWQDVSEEPDGEGHPYTLARVGLDPGGGVGALQLSPALRATAAASAAELLAMVEEFGESNSLGLPFDRVTDAGPPALAAVSYHRDEDFIRVWFVTVGEHLTLVTYVAEAGAEEEELDECEEIVRSLRYLA